MKHLTIDNCQIEIGNIEQSSFQTLISEQFGKSKKIILVDENTHDYCLEYLITTFPALEEAEVMLLPVGEENKVMEVCFQVWEAFSEYGINRSDLVINLGGGVVTDMGGFIASIFKRGLAFVHIPTTLLGMVDASIGGKTGIDLGPHKNQLGTFQHPHAVFIDPRFLSTLPEEELVSGYAEVLKHALISDADLWNKLATIKPKFIISSPDLEAIVARSVELKVDVVNQDPLEKNVRKKLNFGHTIGHAIEGVCLLNQPVAHGHAVAIGMIAESYISMRNKLISKDVLMEVVARIQIDFPTILLSEEDKLKVLELVKNDKKNNHLGIQCVLLNKIGEAKIDVVISEGQVYEALLFVDSIYAVN